jgi:hypothetical protein
VPFKSSISLNTIPSMQHTLLQPAIANVDETRQLLAAVHNRIRTEATVELSNTSCNIIRRDVCGISPCCSNLRRWVINHRSLNQ